MAAAPSTVSAPPSAAAASPNPNRRGRPFNGNGSKSKKKTIARSDEPVRRRANKPSAKFLKLIRKRVRDYNSDDDDRQQQEHDDDAISVDEEEEAARISGDESGGVTRFEQGCRAFRVAFLEIMTTKFPDEPRDPAPSARKKLVAAKLAESVEEHKPKGKARKEKRAAAEKGHVFLPDDHFDIQEKELMKIATHGVVKLFNAVSKGHRSLGKI